MARSGGQRQPASKSTRTTRSKGRDEAAEAGEEQDITAFLTGLAAALKARGKPAKEWKLEVLAAALSKAAATLPEVAGKYVKANLQRCAELLHEQLVEVAPPKAAAGKRGAAAAADKEGAWPAKAAKRAKTAAVLSPGAPMALLFDGTYQQAVEQCLAGQPPAGTGTLALACARSPPPATLLASTLGLLSAPVDLEAVQLPAALAAAGRAVGACSALAALAPSAAEGVACFAAVAGWLLEVAGSMQDPQWYRHAARAKELWAQLAAVAARLMACLDLLLRQWQLPEAEGEDDGSSGGQWLMALQAAGGSSGSASEAAKRTAAQVVTLRAMCHFMAGRLGATGGSSGSAAAGSDAGQVAQAVQDLRRLAPFGVAGQAELMAGTPQDSIQASPDSARSFLGLCKALEQQPTATPREFLLRLAVARKAADACRAAGLAREADASLASASRRPAPPELADCLRRQPPSAIVTAALEAARAGGQEGLSAYLVRTPSLKVLLALARSVGEDSGDEAAGATVGEVAAGEGGDAEGEGGADELLFFVSTDADQTMFGRDWGADESEGEEKDDEEGAGVLLGELSGGEDSESSGSQGGESDSD